MPLILHKPCRPAEGFSAVWFGEKAPGRRKQKAAALVRAADFCLRLPGGRANCNLNGLRSACLGLCLAIGVSAGATLFVGRAFAVWAAIIFASRGRADTAYVHTLVLSWYVTHCTHLLKYFSSLKKFLYLRKSLFNENLYSGSPT
jgi:hypothetical protein